MKRKLQIEELARVIHDSDKIHNNIFPVSLRDCISKHGSTRTAEAVALYNAGYRKQSEGEWVSVEGDVIFKCSICDAEISTSWDYENDDMWGFCPCCGAKMKGGTR